MRTLPLGIGRGLRMEIDFAHQTRLYFGLYETELNGVIRELARPERNVFDVGAQFGFDALVMGRLTGAAVLTIECFEPTIAILHRNVAANEKLSSNIRVVEAFIGTAKDVEDLGGFAEDSVKYHRQISGTPTATLDDLATKHFVPDLIKLDIEGAEMSALQGSQTLLREHKPDWIIETHSEVLDSECRRLLETSGYSVQTIEPRSGRHQWRDPEHNRWLIARCSS